jgi:hypothetical protein
MITTVVFYISIDQMIELKVSSVEAKSVTRLNSWKLLSPISCGDALCSLCRLAGQSNFGSGAQSEHTIIMSQ